MASSSYSVSRAYSNNELLIHRLDFSDKLLLNVYIDGVIDTTFDIPVGAKTAINYSTGSELDLGVEPRLLVGDALNVKLLVVASQIAKLAFMKVQKNIILSLGLKWFGKDIKDDDFEKLMVVLDGVKEVMEK